MYGAPGPHRMRAHSRAAAAPGRGVRGRSACTHRTNALCRTLLINTGAAAAEPGYSNRRMSGTPVGIARQWRVIEYGTIFSLWPYRRSKQRTRSTPKQCGCWSACRADGVSRSRRRCDVPFVRQPRHPATIRRRSRSTGCNALPPSRHRRPRRGPGMRVPNAEREGSAADSAT